MSTRMAEVARVRPVLHGRPIAREQRNCGVVREAALLARRTGYSDRSSVDACLPGTNDLGTIRGSVARALLTRCHAAQALRR